MKKLIKKLNYKFTNMNLLREALTHGGLNVNRNINYERLEFLGDRILSFIIADLLIKNFPVENEGALSKRLAALVKADTLVEVARDLDLGTHIITQGNDRKIAESPGRLADVCEAVIAAIYLDGGLNSAQNFVMHHWLARLKNNLQPPTDPKTGLQEWAQARGYPVPHYVNIRQDGPDHAPLFTVSVQVENLKSAEGEGATKRKAEKLAALRLLEQLGAHD